MFLGLESGKYFGTREGYLFGVSPGTLGGLMISIGVGYLVGSSLGLTLYPHLNTKTLDLCCLSHLWLRLLVCGLDLKYFCSLCRLVDFQKATCRGVGIYSSPIYGDLIKYNMN